MTMFANQSHDPVAELAYAGTFFSGNHGPPITLIIIDQNGGLVDLSPVGGNVPVVDVTVRRWDPRSERAIGSVVTEAIAAILDQTVHKGQALFDWQYAGPIDHVPNETGWYMLQANVTFPNGQDPDTQRAIFQVLPSGRSF